MRTTLLSTRALALALLGLACAPAFAQQAIPAATPPAWEQLTTAQRELLIAPLRDRWNANPDERARMLDHARRWQSMTPEQRAHARKGMRRWEHMSPEQREHARALFQRMRGMSPEQRRALREQWRAMTPDQRREWMRQHAPQSATP